MCCFIITGQKIEHYPDSLEVLKLWSERCEIAIASRTNYPQGAESLIKLFGFDKYVNYKQIYPGCKHTHFKALHEESKVDFGDMLFFDDEFRNIRDLRQYGVESILIDPDIGVTKKIVDDAVKKTFHGWSKV